MRQERTQKVRLSSCEEEQGADTSAEERAKVDGDAVEGDGKFAENEVGALV